MRMVNAISLGMEAHKYNLFILFETLFIIFKINKLEKIVLKHVRSN